LTSFDVKSLDSTIDAYNQECQTREANANRLPSAVVNASLIPVYFFILFLIFSHQSLFNFNSTVIGLPGDTGGFIWFLRWWPHALLSGHDPFFSADIWYPIGQDLVWNTSVPFLSLASYPLSLVLSPIAQYNTVFLLTLTLDAWYGYRLLRRIGTGALTSWLLGWLVPFSSYVVGQSQGHLDLIAIFPIFGVLFAIQDLLETNTDWSKAWARLILWYLVSLYTGLELALDTTLCLVILTSVNASRLNWQEARRRIVALKSSAVYLSLIVAFLGLALLVLAIFARYTSFQYNAPATYSADLANYFVPTVVQGIFGNPITISNHFLGNASENGAFIALPSLAVVIWYVKRGGNTLNKQLFGTLALIASILSLGPFLTVVGYHITPLPMYLFQNAPILKNILPVRLTVFVLPFILIAWSDALTHLNQPLRKSILLLALFVTLTTQGPYLAGGFWNFKPDIPKFFTTGLYKQTITRNSVIAFANSWVVNGQSSIAQADTNFYFKMIGFEAASNNPPQEGSLLLPPVANSDIVQESMTFRSDLSKLGAQYYIVPEQSYLAHQSFYRLFKFTYIGGVYIATRNSNRW